MTLSGALVNGLAIVAATALVSIGTGLNALYRPKGRGSPPPAGDNPSVTALPWHRGRCTPRVLVPLRFTAWASPPTEGRKGCLRIMRTT